MAEVDKDLLELLNRDARFRYQMLGRMQRDCVASIGNGYLDHLWGITVDTHIKYMEALWRSFPKNEKPRWCRLKDIKEYKRQLKLIINRGN